MRMDFILFINYLNYLDILLLHTLLCNMTYKLNNIEIN